ncbi:MAG TPA: hypothetical protein VGJ34_09995 [Gaiellaceae bacterium]
MKPLAPLLAALLLAGCGTLDRPADTASSTTPATASGEFTIEVPEGWLKIDRRTPATSAFLARYAPSYPELSTFAELMKRPDSPFRLIAFAQSRTGAVEATMNVIAVRLRKIDSFAEFERGMQTGLEKRSILGSPRFRRHDLPAGEAVKVTYRIDPASTAGCTCVAITQYAVHAGGWAYILTYSTVGEGKERYAQVFERSARSFRSD